MVFATPEIPRKDPNTMCIPKDAHICYLPGPDATVNTWAFKHFLKKIACTYHKDPSYRLDFVVYGQYILGETIEEVVAEVSKRKNAISLKNFIEIVN